MVTEGRIASASILDRVFTGLHLQGAWDYQTCYGLECSFIDLSHAINTVDAVLFLRCTRPEEAALFEQAQKQGLATVYCVDDDFDALDPSTPLGQFYSQPGMKDGRERMMRQADLVWVFTAEMANRLRDRCRQVHVGRLPSFVEDHGWDLKSIDDDADGPLTIGYGGRYLHARDLQVIVEPLRQILDSSDRPVRAQFVDCLPVGLQNHEKVTLLPYVDDIRQYYRYLRTAGWAIGLAPLRDNAENRAKTNNKYREYAALGIPGIYSDMPVYASSVRHRETGYLAPHTEQGMYEALRTLVADADLRKRIRRRALEDAATTYALLPMQQEWLREVSLLASRRHPAARLLVVAHDSVTSTHIDALPAARALEQQGRVRFKYVQPTETRRADVERCDAVFLVRAFAPETVALLAWTEEAGAAVVCAWDDDFYALPPNTALGRYHAHVIVRAAMDRFLRECSLVMTSTPPLSERSRRYSPRVMEAIYGFDTSQLPLEPLPADAEDERSITLGFFGLQWDVAPPCVREAVRKVKQRFGSRIQFEIIASCEVPDDSADLFTWQSTRVMSWAESLQLLRRRGWDIGLAPLEDTEFFAAKQATKFRDYAWAGLAIACSRVPTYERVIIDGIHGLLIENTAPAWESALARLIEDGPLRLRLRRAARDLFAQAHTLDATLCAWQQLLWRVACHRHRDTPPAGGFEVCADEHEESRRSAKALAALTQLGMSASPRLTGTRFYELVPEADGWTTLDVMLGLHRREAAGRLVLSIYADGVTDRPVRRIASNLTEAVDNGLFRFTFPPIVDSGHRRMLLSFNLEHAGQDTRVSLYEHGPRAHSLINRVWSRLSRKGGRLFCYLGFHRDA
jgi:glycosyltransferase involved in cell wall biosynthesis